MPTTQEQEIIDRVSAKLRGEFYVGQRVVCVDASEQWEGTITRFRGLNGSEVQIRCDDSPETAWYPTEAFRPA